MKKLSTQIASNVRDNSLALEVTDAEGSCIAVVERFDTDNRLHFQMFRSALDVACVKRILQLADEELQEFEDGTPLSEANCEFRFDPK